MRIQLLLFGAIACGGTLFGSAYYDGMKDLLSAGDAKTLRKELNKATRVSVKNM